MRKFYSFFFSLLRKIIHRAALLTYLRAFRTISAIYDFCICYLQLQRQPILHLHGREILSINRKSGQLILKCRWKKSRWENKFAFKLRLLPISFFFFALGRKKITKFSANGGLQWFWPPTLVNDVAHFLCDTYYYYHHYHWRIDWI